MEKYAVNDVRELQEKELKQVRSRLEELRGSLEKTAAETQEVERLEAREAEIALELQD